VDVYYLDWRGVRLRIREGETVIGRGVGCELHIDDPTSSRRHAAVDLRGGRLTVRDLGSRNGTFLNGDRVQQPRPLAKGDRLLVGESLFTVGVADDGALVEGDRLSLPPAVTDGLALVEQGGKRAQPQDATQPHVGTIEVIESLLDSPHAQDEPVALASMVQSSVDRLLANLERRNASLPELDLQRLMVLIDRVVAWFPDGSLNEWKAKVRVRLGR
jgi:predicted component of type VI protein secretion system